MLVVPIAVAAFAAPALLPPAGAPGRPETSRIQWRPFDRAAIPALVAAGKTVFVDVTADWCITCQVNKSLVLETDEMAPCFARADMVAMRADWTLPDPAISDYLASVERYGIPFNAVYSPGAPGGIDLPEILTGDAVRAALRKTGGAESQTPDSSSESIFDERGIGFWVHAIVFLSDSLLAVICEEQMMTRSLRADLRGRVIAAIEDGMSTREAARRFAIGISTTGS